MILLLLTIGILLVLLNIKAIKKEKNSFSSVFHHTEENMEEFEVKLGEIRREFSETILELQKEIQKLKKINENDIIVNNDNFKAKEVEKNYEKTNEEVKEHIAKNIDIESNEKVTDNSNENEDRNTKTNNSVKIDEISKLLSKGLSVEEIGAKLGIGKGEVLLIKELYLK